MAGTLNLSTVFLTIVLILLTCWSDNVNGSTAAPPIESVDGEKHSGVDATSQPENKLKPSDPDLLGDIKEDTGGGGRSRQDPEDKGVTPKAGEVKESESNPIIDPGVSKTSKPVATPDGDPSKKKASVGAKEDKNQAEKPNNLAQTGNNGSPTECDLSTLDPEVFVNIRDMVNSGTKLLEYRLEFPQYETNPLLENMGDNFLTSKWQRAFTSHGKTLLSLSFNYNVLSVTMLSFGVASVKIEIADEPKGCFGQLSAEAKLEKIMDAVMSDFKAEVGNRKWVGEFDYACHQVIHNISNIAKFEYRCYESVEGQRIRVKDEGNSKWLRLLYVIILLLKLIVFLMGPLIMSLSFKKFEYIVKLQDPVLKVLLATKQPCQESAGDNEEIEEFKKFKKKMESVPLEKPTVVSIRKLEIKVDHSRLISEKSVPVGLFRYLFETIILCGIRRSQPFVSCCAANVFGSWSPKFLWLKLFDSPNICGKRVLRWKDVFRCIGGLLLLVLVPIPYYIRLAIYFSYEEEEVSARKEAIEPMGLRYPWENTLIHYLDPAHPAMIFAYCQYAISFIILGAIRAYSEKLLDKVAKSAFSDMRKVNKMECFRLMLSHFTLPIEKFGCCGIIITAIYWPIAMVFCLIVTICYSLPTVYLLGRFFIQSRFRFIRECPTPTPRRHPLAPITKQTLTDGTTSIESALLLNNISDGTKNISNASRFNCKTEKGEERIISLLVGLACGAFMLSILLLSIDVLGFVVEVFVFTLMGAIVNASNASKFIMLLFWILIYASSCFNNMYDKYMVLNGHIFKFIKGKLADRLKDVAILSEGSQNNMAFKFFNKTELRELCEKEHEAEMDSDSDSDEEMEEPPNIYTDYHTMEESLTRKGHRLNWRIYNMVLFFDDLDTPYIPKGLFFEICKLRGPGCPGPIHASLLQAFKQLGYMTLFLVFVIITVMTFGEAYKASSTNQMMVTLAGGFIPFVVRFVLKPKKADLFLNSYSFKGRIHQIIFKYSELWPVSDIPLEIESTKDDTKETNANDLETIEPRPYSDDVPSPESQIQVNGAGFCGVNNGEMDDDYKDEETQTTGDGPIDAPSGPSVNTVCIQTTTSSLENHPVDILVDLNFGKVVVDKPGHEELQVISRKMSSEELPYQRVNEEPV